MAGPMSSQPSAIASISNDPLRDPLDSSLPPRPTISSLPSAQVETGTKAPTKTKRCREDGLTKRQRYRARKAQRPQQNVAQTLELGGGTTMVTSGVNDATMQRGEVQGEPKPTRMCLPKDISSVPQTILASAAHDPRDSRALPPSPPTTPEPQSSEGHMHDPSSSSHTTPSGQKWHVPLQSPFVDAHATSARTRRSHPDWSFPDDTPILRYDTPPLTPAVMLKRPGSGKRARSSDMEISSGAGEKRVRIQRKLPWTASVCRGSSQDVSDDPDPARPFLFKPELAPATLGPALSIAASHPAQHDSARLSASQQADLDRSRANYMVAKKHIDMLSHRVRDEHKKRMALEEKLSAAHKERRAVDERLNEMRKVVANLEAERNANLAAKSKDEVRKMYAGGAKGVLQKAEDSVGAVADSGVVAEQKGKSVREQLIDIGDHLRHLETRLSSSSPGDPEPSPRPELAYDCTSIDTSARRITPSDAPTVDTSVNMAYEDRKILRQTKGKLKQARLRIAELERLVSQYIVSTLELMSENIALRRRY